MRCTYCPVCGQKLILRDRGDEGPVPYCESCGKSRHDSFTTAIIAAVVNEGNEVALLRQGYIAESTYVCVSGIMRPGESAEETAVREIQEELGLTVRELRYMGSWPYPRKDMLMLGFLALADKAPLRLSDEVDSARWVPFAEAPGLIREGTIARRLTEASIALRRSIQEETS